MTNPFLKYLEEVEKNPREYSKEIIAQVKLQREMLKKYDFVEEQGKKCVDWIEKHCYLTEGENSGERVKLMLWHKWIIYSIFCFYGYLDVEEFDEDGKFVGIVNKYVRIVKDVLIIVASGNSKTTLLAMIILYVMYHNKVLPSPKIYIGSNAYKQSKVCFDVARKIIRKNQELEKYAIIRQSIGEIEIEETNAKVMAMSSTGDNYEGIIPALLVIDEIHAMTTSTYADNLRKSTKRSDSLIIEITTDGTVRGGYLDQRKELANNLLFNKTEEKDYRKFFAIYKQDSEEEVFEAFRNGDISLLRKSNPALSIAVSVDDLKNKVRDMMNDPKLKVITLTKNFNVPQNPITSFFSETECRAKPFNEDIFYEAPVFLGLDMAYTRNPSNDLTALTMMMVNPFTNEEYYKDFYFLPKWWEQEYREDGQTNIRMKDMVIEKSRVDTNILYNPKQNAYGYQMYADRGDVIVVDEQLIEELVQEFGEQARCDTTGITEDFVKFYIAHLERKYNWLICKFGLDPNKAYKLKSFSETNIPSTDGKNPVISFRMEDKKNSNPIILSTKDIRKQGKVYCNNKLTELHFASAIAKEDSYGNIIFTNAMYSRKDGVISHLSSRSAYNVYTTNKHTGNDNLELLKTWWRENQERIDGILSKDGVQKS
jgi:phage terminase large subunit-like protein